MPLNIDFQQVLLHMLNFALLFGILYFLLYKPVKDFMDKREQAYLDRENGAKATEEEAERLKASYEEKLANAGKEIEAMRDAAEKELAANAAAVRAKAQSDADAILDKARKDAAREHDTRLSDANREITTLAADAAKKLLFADTSAAYDAFLNEVHTDDGN